MLHYHLTLAHSFAKDRFIKYRSTNLLLAYIPQNLQVHILSCHFTVLSWAQKMPFFTPTHLPALEANEKAFS